MKELASVSIFQKLSPKELKELGSIVTRRTFGPDTVVFFEGDRSDSLYVILSGSTKVYQTSDDGKEKILRTFGKGEIFGEFAMLDGHPRSASVATLEPTEMLAISHGDFRSFVESHPEALWKVTEALCERIRNMSDEMVNVTLRDVPYRLLRALNQLVERHGEASADGKGARLSTRLSVQELAGMIGASPDRVSRLLDKFHADGLVQLGEHLAVPDVKALKRSLEYAQDWS